MKIKINHIPALVISILLLVVVVAAYVYMRSVVSDSLAQAIAAKDEVLNQQAIRSQNKGLLAQYKDTASARAKLSTLLVSSKNPVTLIESIENLEKMTGVKVEIVAIDTPPGDNTQAVIHATAHGSWGSMMKVLHLIEDLPYATAVDHMSLDTSVLGKGTAQRTWNMGVYIRAALI